MLGEACNGFFHIFAELTVSDWLQAVKFAASARDGFCLQPGLNSL
jgi:hypothetical protein